jgi:hypothetical protein
MDFPTDTLPPQAGTLYYTLTFENKKKLPCCAHKLHEWYAGSCVSFCDRRTGPPDKTPFTHSPRSAFTAVPTGEDLKYIQRA